MALHLSADGIGFELAFDLPFDNRMELQLGTIPDPTEAFVEAENTHLWIVDTAIDLLKPHEPRLYRLLRDKSFRTPVCQALWDADKRAPFNDLWWNFVPSWRSHFYDPDTRRNWRGGTETAVHVGSAYARRSARAMLRGSHHKAAYALGIALHYLGDMTQPMHAANFTWMDSPKRGYHTDFERYVKQALHRIEPPARYKPLLPDSAPKAYFHAVARRSKDRYFAALVKPEWVQAYSRRWDHTAWEERVGAVVPQILHDAAQVTAQMLSMWFREVSVTE